MRKNPVGGGEGVGKKSQFQLWNFETQEGEGIHFYMTRREKNTFFSIENLISATTR